MAYLIRHQRLRHYIAEHDVWPTYITPFREAATRYSTREEAEARRLAIGEDFAPFFEVIADD